jgi:hypothetical protein
MFRFSIRDVLWLMCAAGLLIAWRLDRTNLIDTYDPKTRLEATVIRVHNAEQLADVSLGYDDGVIVGDSLNVFRDQAAIGEIRLLEVEPDTSRGVIRTRGLAIQNGDKATIELRHSDFRRLSKLNRMR